MAVVKLPSSAIRMPVLQATGKQHRQPDERDDLSLHVPDRAVAPASQSQGRGRLVLGG